MSLLTASVVENPLIGLVVAIPGIILGWLGHRRAERADLAAAATAATTAQGAAIQQVIDGLNHIVDNLQDDNRVLRENVDTLSKRLAELAEENHRLRSEVAALKRQYGADG